MLLLSLIHILDAPRTEWEHWANADSAIVHADFRGNGLQRLMLEAALPLFPKKITHIGATVSPQNQYSLHNALASGFAIVYGLGEMPHGINKRGWHYVTKNTDEARHSEDKLSYYGAHNFLLIDGGAGRECFGVFKMCIRDSRYSIMQSRTKCKYPPMRMHKF